MSRSKPLLQLTAVRADHANAGRQWADGKIAAIRSQAGAFHVFVQNDSDGAAEADPPPPTFRQVGHGVGDAGGAAGKSQGITALVGAGKMADHQQVIMALHQGRHRVHIRVRITGTVGRPVVIVLRARRVGIGGPVAADEKAGVGINFVRIVTCDVEDLPVIVITASVGRNDKTQGSAGETGEFIIIGIDVGIGGITTAGDRDRLASTGRDGGLLKYGGAANGKGRGGCLSQTAALPIGIRSNNGGQKGPY